MANPLLVTEFSLVYVSKPTVKLWRLSYFQVGLENQRSETTKLQIFKALKKSEGRKVAMKVPKNLNISRCARTTALRWMHLAE